VVSEEKIFKLSLCHSLFILLAKQFQTKIWWEAPMEGSVLSFLKAK
jgi:hypothetical protein